MRAPNIKNANIINKNIVFNNNVLPLKEENPNLKLSTIENISEYSLEQCIKIIIENNLEATFHTIQYSKEKKKVYFYADKLLEKQQWYDISKINHQPLNSEIEILEELKKVLKLSINKNSDCISLYQITNYLDQYNDKFSTFKSEQLHIIEETLKKEYPSSYVSCIYFSYPFFTAYDKKHSLDLRFSILGNKTYEISFIKNNNSLIIEKDNACSYSQEILKTVGDYISKAYDGYLSFFDFKTQSAHNITPINSNFYVSITDSHITIKNSNELKNNAKSEISCFFYSDKEKKRYNYETKYNNFISIAKNNEEEIFKKIYVKIENCPKWMQEELFCIRQNELTEERRKQEEIDITTKKSQVEEQPQKKLSLKNFFSKKK